MNQILSTNNEKKKRNNELIDMRKIIITFSALIILFALVIVVAKVYGIIKESSKEKDNPIASLNKPTIEITRIDKGCRIYVKYDEGLDKITYRWNDGETIEKNWYGSTNPFDKTIKIPDGDKNKLFVEAIGSDGSINTIEKVLTEDGIVEYDSRPEIEANYSNVDGKIIIEISAKSDVGMKSLAYQWEDEEAQTVYSTGEDQKEITVNLQAKRGSNRLYIIATDINNKTTEKNETILGVASPTIDIVIEGTRTLKIDITHDMGFKKVIIKINNKELVYDENYPGYSTEETKVSLTHDLPAGRNNVEVKVYTLEEPEKEYVRSGWTEVLE